MTQTFILPESQIAREAVICPYCGEEKVFKLKCCGETHFENVYVTLDGEFYPKENTRIEKEELNVTIH